ncbi:MAG: uncharacterized protein JWN04_5632 [Myxococcaceae bacterium]|nr:uncharacterized protein [Myxococcaceae bacterium]
MHWSLNAPYPIHLRLVGLRHGALALALSLVACSSGGSDHGVGELALSLTTRAGDITYRLSNATFSLAGPENRDFAVDDRDELELSLTAGAYRLTLQDGFQLLQKDAPGSPPVHAHLISQNPSPVLISPGETSRATLRFELDSDAGTPLGAGTLQVGIEVGTADAGGDAGSPCALGLRIDELDYDQTNGDDGEFVELLNTGTCTSALDGVVLELVNGGDGKVYTRYTLTDATPSLAAGERLVLGDPAVLATLTAATKHLALNGAGLQNGPDGMRLVRGDTLLDAVAYEGAVAGSGEGQPTLADEGASSLTRCPDGFDTNDNKLDFQLSTPSPGAPSVCP